MSFIVSFVEYDISDETWTLPSSCSVMKFDTFTRFYLICFHYQTLLITCQAKLSIGIALTIV